jgi:hypothetical protein
MIFPKSNQQPSLTINHLMLDSPTVSSLSHRDPFVIRVEQNDHSV